MGVPVRISRHGAFKHIYAEVLLACAMATRNELGWFTLGKVRAPLEGLIKRSIRPANYIRHMEAFCTPKRGYVLEKQGEPWSTSYRFPNLLVQTFTLMRALAEKRITQEQFLALRPSAEDEETPLFADPATGADATAP